jgi:hypothetical protein
MLSTACPDYLAAYCGPFLSPNAPPPGLTSGFYCPVASLRFPSFHNSNWHQEGFAW